MRNDVPISKTRTVDIIIYPGFKALEAIGPLKVFDYTNTCLRQRQLSGGYEVAIASTKIGMIVSDTLMSLEATKAISTLALPDLAIIVGAPDIEKSLQDSPEIVEWVANAAPKIQRLAALCTGSFFLAEGGALDGRRATTHWRFSERLGKKYPAIKVDADAIFIREGNIWTSAGVTAGMDLALAIVEEDFGREIALEVARDLVIYLKRPGGQSQFSVHLSSQMTTHPTIRELQSWIMLHLDDDLSIPKLAARIAMSERNFARVFQRETAESPAEFIESARFEVARRMLEENTSALKQIVLKTGFRTEEKMRRVFQKKIGVTPKVYRERFSTTV
ncbi:DJ-1/PfpI family protein [Glaciimonas sp. CA11.2]|uniref:GlxA family transcriptional regulator n=1 Tax=unclassified Glaciimonas TaxID=2644401 RepID=UPI002AB584C4|nr:MULTISPECIES: DJ-1/PfpI family protein [unclassified Glaciimonas]MDY7545695.1 DJ-1/PfpI family protein [Glaciimonas sp. CA11.2]MEB0011656.1 DJ-1/PfpI family protein [Glaciimonas sp. Cout2]MEB0081453.1 DJ-1/PfpI family protein [Glaciimonas sp. Gout2]MEB0161459.1 DJ-1/PfpI family protein [Glaciimonas sp. CA11.2]